MTVIKFKDKEFTVLGGTTHPGYSFYTFEEEEADFRNKYWNIKEGDVVMDVGASYGSYSLTACASGATVYSFEPEKSVHKDLILNINHNKWENKCFAFDLGFWSSKAQIDMREYAPHWPPDTIAPFFDLVTMDSFIKQSNITKLDWLKIDVEGAEAHVIFGGLDSIRKLKPKLIIECHTFLDASLVDKIKNMLTDIYKFEEVKRDPCIMLVGVPTVKRPIESGFYQIITNKTSYWHKAYYDSNSEDWSYSAGDGFPHSEIIKWNFAADSNEEYVNLVNSNKYPESIVVPLDAPFNDERGTIQNLWLGHSGSITFIESKKYAVRAKHRHKADWHTSYIINGKVKYIEGEENYRIEHIFSAGDLFFTKPDVYHEMHFLEDTKMITINNIVKNHSNYEKSVVRSDEDK